MNWLKKLLRRGSVSAGSLGAPPEPGGSSPSPSPAADPVASTEIPWERLLVAVRTNDFGTMRELVSDDLSLLRHTDDDGATILHHAALAGHPDIVQYLMDCDADLEVRDDARGARPIDWANDVGHTPIVRLLYGHGAAASLHEAAAYGLVERVRTILEEEPPDVNEAAGYGTPLHYAVLWGQSEIAELLLDAGADYAATNAHGCDAAAIAAHQLESRGGDTAILVASRRSELAAGWVRCAELLAERASD